MRVRHSGRWLCSLLLTAVCGVSAHEFIGADGPDWMRPETPVATTRQATPPTPDRRITTSPGQDVDPVWSADGTLLAFASNRAGSYDIYISRTDGSNPDTGEANTPKLISGLPGDERYPAFSPGGTELAYIRGSAIYIRNLRNGVESLVADNIGSPRDLVFSFDGQRLAFSTRITAAPFNDLAENIYWISLNPNNRTLTQVTSTATIDRMPAWFPESQRIMFASNRGGDYDIYIVNVPGPNAGPAPDPGAPIVGGAGDQMEPAWVNAGGISDPAYNQAFHILYADDEGGAHLDLKVADSDGNPVGDIVYTDRNAATPGDQTMPFANPVQNNASALCVYAGDQSGNFELYTIPIFDISAPILSNGVDTQLPTVTPQQTFPGASVRIEANIFDVGSGVGEAFALIRRAERSVFQRNPEFADGRIESNGVINSNGTSGVAVGNENVEYEQLIIDANTYGNIDPSTVNATEAGLDALVRNSGLRLYDDGSNGGDRIAGDGIWTGTWATPALAQDFYVDIIPYDTRGNFPVDTNLAVNNRPGGGANPLAFIGNFPGNGFYAVGYDHVAGFTTRSLDLTRKILFVSDYGCGQKFQVADFAGERQTTLNRFWPAALPIEHYYFHTDDSNSTNGIPASQSPDTPQFVLYGSSPPTVHFIGNPYYGAWGFGGFIDDHTADNAMVERGSPPVYPYGGEFTNDRKAVWRILCRGPVDAPTYNAYTPLPLPQPAGSPVPAQDADRMILWISPYTGDLFVQPGTLLDADVQSSLGNFVRSGGRLFVTGQDVAWALTKNGTQANTFLTSVLRANFVSDAPPEIISQTVRGGNQRRFLTPASALTGIELQVFQTSENPIANDLYFDYFKWLNPNGGLDLPSQKPIRLNTGDTPGEAPRTSTWWGGDGAPNGWFIDDITPASGGIETFSYATGGQSAMVRHIDPGTGGRVIFSAFGFESVRNGFSYVPGFRTNQNWVIGHNDRVEMFTNISDYLRTGAFLGKVVGPDGSTPVGGITVIARLGPSEDGQIMATTTSLADGTYLLRGLSTGNYSVYVASNEFTADHRPYQASEGGQVLQNSDLTIRLLRFETGTIFGTVTKTDGSTVAGATVTIRLQTTAANPLTETVQTDNNGQYSVDVPGGTYSVTAEAPGLGAATTTDVIVVPGDVVQVDLVLQPEPGTLTGTIRGGNQPVSGATVAIQQNGITVATATTNAAGVYTVSLSEGTYNLIVTSAGFEQATADGVIITSTETTTQDFSLNAVPPGSLVGLITAQGGTDPIGGVVVNLITGGAVVRTTTSTEATTTQDGDTYNYRFDDIPAGTYDVQVQAQGYSAPTRTGILVQSGQVTTGIDFSLQPLHTFIAGLTMTSTPYDYTAVAPDIQTLIDDDNNRQTPLRLATWDTATGRYIYYPNPPANTFRLGRGYFMRLDRNVPLTVQGIRAPEVGNGFDIQLLAGWNLIGHPYEFPVDFFACRVIFGQQNLSIQEASAQGLVNAALYTLNFGQYQQVFRLDPYTAYWIRSFQNVILRVPPTALRSVSEPNKGREALTPGSWRATVTARAGELRASGSFGAEPDAGDVYDRHDRAQPPRPPSGGYLELSFPHEDWGRFSDRYRSDVHGGKAADRWELEVATDQAGVPVELSWPALGTEVPSSLSVVLEDLQTGARRSLRHTSSYVYTPTSGGVRRFAIEVAPQTSRPRITAVTVNRSRGGLAVGYTLSAPLTMSIELRGPAGSLVRRLVRGDSRAAGTESVLWDGRDEQGRPVPNGTYTLVLVGVSDTGEQVREIRTVQHRR